MIAAVVLAAGASTRFGSPKQRLLLARAAWVDIPDTGLRDRPAEPVECDDLSPPGDVDSADDINRR